MNRAVRLCALVAELRAASRPRSASWLARSFAISARTVERDVRSLRRSGLPIVARRDGYTLDRSRVLPPLQLAPSEAVAVAVALHRLGGTPFHADAASALRKLGTVLPETDDETARELAERLHFAVGHPAPVVPRVIADALHGRTVLRIDYTDRYGMATTRHVEPLGYVGNREYWYLVAWCRLRDGVRAFRTDRIESVTGTAEPAPPRRLLPSDLDLPGDLVRPLVLG
ncbi:helix-turn-helix transcriptional regulator [Phytohabitans aurantiacus]|uniref:Transcriptional regulator n=1 Tax=Phytohabitans aurantiacus TaxID=3016789 RepID=A0ABQ5R8E3_9ACTN|nr:WYL domain-containing protein [Phytohabitans aurantiacus]GLI03034.1 transcriptional regulator [Phytohabitans aurantiacus]